MRVSKRMVVLLMAVVLSLVFSAAVFAEQSVDTTEAAEVLTAAAESTEQTSTGNKYSIGIFVTDGEGNPIQSGGLMSCINGGINLYVEHDYTLKAMYYDAEGKTYETSEQLILSIETSSEESSKYVNLDFNTVKLSAAPEPYVLSMRVVNPSSDNGEAKFSAQIKKYNFDLTDILVAAVGVYLIVGAIRGTGSMFSDEFIKDDKKQQFKRIMRIVSVIAGVVLIATAVVGILFGYIDWTKALRYVLLGIAIVILILIGVINSIFTDKEKKAKAQMGSTGGHTSSAAFEFDGTEPTLDDVLNDLEKKEKSSEVKEK